MEYNRTDMADAIDGMANILQALADNAEYQSLADTLENYVRELQTWAKRKRTDGRD